MKRLKNVCLLLVAIGGLNMSAQSSGITMSMEMKPILQVEMVSEDQIDFVFNSKEDFTNGIVKKSATILKITSTVNWDMYAIGRPLSQQFSNGKNWNQKKSFKRSENSVASIPLSLLELHQSNRNNGDEGSNGLYSDYSQSFKKEVNGGNSIYVSSDGSLSPPNNQGKYIAGHSGISEDHVKDYIPAGTYNSGAPNQSDYYYEMDYRILPGYPAIFPNAVNEDATVYEDIVSYSKANNIIAGKSNENVEEYYAEPGVYTMKVQYIILEDQ